MQNTFGYTGSISSEGRFYAPLANAIVRIDVSKEFACDHRDAFTRGTPRS